MRCITVCPCHVQSDHRRQSSCLDRLYEKRLNGIIENHRAHVPGMTAMQQAIALSVYKATCTLLGHNSSEHQSVVSGIFFSKLLLRGTAHFMTIRGCGITVNCYF